MRKTEKALLGAAVAGLLSAVSSGFVYAADKAKQEASKDVQCLGVNGCKGKSSCASATSSCSAQNSCKGKGWVKVSKEICDQLGGTVQAEGKKS